MSIAHCTGSRLGLLVSLLAIAGCGDVPTASQGTLEGSIPVDAKKGLGPEVLWVSTAGGKVTLSPNRRAVPDCNVKFSFSGLAPLKSYEVRYTYTDASGAMAGTVTDLVRGLEKSTFLASSRGTFSLTASRSFPPSTQFMLWNTQGVWLPILAPQFDFTNRCF